jgi:hypothetical protein
MRIRHKYNRVRRKYGAVYSIVSYRKRPYTRILRQKIRIAVTIDPGCQSKKPIKRSGQPKKVCKLIKQKMLGNLIYSLLFVRISVVDNSSCYCNHCYKHDFFFNKILNMHFDKFIYLFTSSLDLCFIK